MIIALVTLMAASESPKKRPALRFGLSVLFAIVAVTAVAFAIMHYVNRARLKAERHAAVVHLRGILSELHVYHDIHGVLPPAIERDASGNEKHSWRFVTCRFLFGDMVQCGFYGQGPQSAYAEPWDGPGNARYYSGPHRDYPGSPTSFIDPTRPGHYTRFVAITGRGTAFEETRQVRLADLDDDTILVVEVRNSNQHWMKPGGDLDIDTMPQFIDLEAGQGISGHDPKGFHVGFADREVWKISRQVPFADLKKLFTIDGAKANDRETVLGSYRLDE